MLVTVWQPKSINLRKCIHHIAWWWAKEDCFREEPPNMERFCVCFIYSWQTGGLCLCVLQAGLIRVSQEEYLIAPLPQHLAEEHNYRAPDGHHPHVIYKRSAEHIVHGRSSGTSSPRPVNPHLQQHRHHQQLQQHEYQHGKLQMQHFCGRRKQCM